MKASLTSSVTTGDRRTAKVVPSERELLQWHLLDAPAGQIVQIQLGHGVEDCSISSVKGDMRKLAGGRREVGKQVLECNDQANHLR